MHGQIGVAKIKKKNKKKIFFDNEIRYKILYIVCQENKKILYIVFLPKYRGFKYGNK